MKHFLFIISQYYISIYILQIFDYVCKDTTFFDISSVGRISFPQLAGFRFLSWLLFVSSVGYFLFPQLAKLHFS